jgi:hypothetical protein
MRNVRMDMDGSQKPGTEHADDEFTLWYGLVIDELGGWAAHRRVL